MKNKRLNWFINIVVILIIIILVTYIFFLKNEKISNEKIAQIQGENEIKKLNAVSTENWDLERVNIVYDSDGIPVPVPKGFIGSSVPGENTINDGFVIYELISTDDDDLKIDEENAWEMSKNRNQFVWVPIYDVNEIYGRDENGIARGKLYSFNSAGKSPCNWSSLSDGTMVINNTGSYYEPMKGDVVTSYAPEVLSEEAKAYNKNFENMIASTIKYGGFYIGRYETGFTSSGANVHRMNTDISNRNWTDMKNRCKTITNNNNVVTEMIYGCQFDAVLQWFYDTKKLTYEQIYQNSGSWGNYYGASFSYFDNNKNSLSKSGYLKLPTGSTEYTKVNNIYDMAGNVWDWTQEAYGSSSAARRGGDYGNSGTGSPAAGRYYDSLSSIHYDYVGCRSTLYIALSTE